MKYPSEDKALRSLYAVHEALAELKTYGVSEQYSLEEEVLLFFRGTPEQLTEYWALAPQAYLQDPTCDEIRRHLLCKWNRGDLFEAAQTLCSPAWTFEDALLIPRGASALRASMLGRPDVRVGFKSESMFETLPIEPGLLALGLAIACADPMAVDAVETKVKGMEGVAQMRLESAAASLKFLDTMHGIPSDEMIAHTIDWAHSQWAKALEDGAIADTASPFLSALNHIHKDGLRPMQNILNTLINSRIFNSSGHYIVLLEKLRDMVWSHDDATGNVGWVKTLAKLSPPVGTMLSQAAKWPMDLTNTNFNADPFIVATRSARWEILQCFKAHAQSHPNRIQLTDERVELWMRELMRHTGQAKHVELGSPRWNERLLTLRMALNGSSIWPNAWMTQHQQDGVQTWIETITPVLDRSIDLMRKALETTQNNHIQMAAFLQTPAWKACVLEMVLVSPQLSPHKPGVRPRF